MKVCKDRARARAAVEKSIARELRQWDGVDGLMGIVEQITPFLTKSVMRALVREFGV